MNHHRRVSTNNSRNIIGRNPSMVIPLLTNQDLTPMLRHSEANLEVKLIEPYSSSIAFLWNFFYGQPLLGTDILVELSSH